MSRAVAAAVGLALAAGLLGGCSGPSEEEELVDTLESEWDMAPEQAECVADQLFERFTDDQIDQLREAEGRDDLPEELVDQLRAALTPCAGS